MSLTNSQKKFIDSVGKAAVNYYDVYKILPSLTIAQAILESGWGKSGLSVKAKNLFGIKCGSSWKGDKFLINTKEWDASKKKYYTIKAAFRKYDSFADSIKDHCKFLQASRYKNLIGEKSYKEACKKIKQDGYATSPTYTEKLIALIEKYDLDQYDKMIVSKTSKKSSHKYYSKPGKYKVIISKHVIRYDPDKDAKVVGSITDKGLYTVVKVSGQYGLLKSYQNEGHHWINLRDDYVKKS